MNSTDAHRTVPVDSRPTIAGFDPGTEGDRSPAGSDGRWPLLIGVGVFALAAALYATTMSLSFVPGDSANYLNLAHTGGLTDRGNGVPLYVTLLNAVIRFPLPFPLSDGARCNLLTILFAAAAIAVSYGAALRFTRRVGPALLAAVALLVSGLVWHSTVLIMPHVSMLLIGALFVFLLLDYDRAPSRRVSVGLGAVAGVGFGLMPDALLLIPVAAAHALLRNAGDHRWAHLRNVATGALVGIVLNALLIALHEGIRPVYATEGHGILWSTLYYLRGGSETGWLVGNLSVVHALQGCVALPLRIAADFEILGSALALTGLVLGFRARPRLSLALLATFVIFSIYSGVYPGDTRILHGIAAYPIAGLWLAGGAEWVFRRGLEILHRMGTPSSASLRSVGLTAVLLVALLSSIAAAQLTYRRPLCASDEWYLTGFCAERVPESAGDRYLRRAERALEAIPRGSLVITPSWDANDQMIYLMRIREDREDLTGPFDLTKLEPEETLSRMESAWGRDQPVYLYGEWKDLEDWLPHLLAHFRAESRSEFLFELLPPTPRDSSDADLQVTPTPGSVRRVEDVTGKIE